MEKLAKKVRLKIQSVLPDDISHAFYGQTNLWCNILQYLLASQQQITSGIGKPIWLSHMWKRSRDESQMSTLNSINLCFIYTVSKWKFLWYLQEKIVLLTKLFQVNWYPTYWMWQPSVSAEIKRYPSGSCYLFGFFTSTNEQFLLPIGLNQTSAQYPIDIADSTRNKMEL